MSMEKVQKVGITEAGDAGLDFSWVDKLYDVNIIITKHLIPENKQLVSALLHNSDRIILHCTCTGYGGTKMEKNVPDPIAVHNGVKLLIQEGFPVSNIVLRTDPIIPTTKGIERVEKVWHLFADTGISRCRYSIIDMYPHVKDRIFEAYGNIPFGSFQAPKRMIEDVKSAVKRNSSLYHFEACAEDLPDRVGCISKKDFAILGKNYSNPDGGFQRKGCLCVSGKTELLNSRKRCPSGCLYCYWKN